MKKEFDIFGVGSPLMDILIQADDNHLIELNLKKGVMHLVDEKQSNSILQRYNKKKPHITPGGDVPNTLTTAAALGAKCALCGKVGKDDFGDMYEDIIKKDNIKSSLVRCKKNHCTGRVIAFITPDAERTFATHLGASINLEKKEVIDDDIKKSRFVYITGYMMETQKELISHVLKTAKKNKIKIAIDLADPHLITRNKKQFIAIVKKFADVLFLNESEAKSLTGKNAKEAITIISRWKIPVVIVKVGKKGALISDNGKVFLQPANKVKAIDTNGAGDTFAGGFLYGLSKGMTLKKCAEIASLAASKIVQQNGAKLNNKHRKELKSTILKRFR